MPTKPRKRRAGKPRAAGKQHNKSAAQDAPVASSRGIAKAAFARHLEHCTIAYLTIPAVLFLFGFFKLIWALPAALALAAAVYFHIKTAAGQFASPRGLIPDAPMPARNLALCIVAAFVATVLFGAGGWGHQSDDWITNNALLTHHTHEPWPVVLQNGAQQNFIVYYFGYFMPAIIAGKVFGFVAANQVLFVWTFIGITLALLWLFVFSRRMALWLIALFFFFSGMDLLGIAVFTETFRAAGNADYMLYQAMHWEWWALPLGLPDRQYSSNLTQIAWLPRHALPAWLLTSLLLKHIAARKPLHSAAFLIGLGVVWSALVPVGLTLLILAYYAGSFKTARLPLRPAFSPQNFLVLPAVFCTAVFYLANTAGTARATQPFVEGGALHLYIIYFLVEFGVLWLVLFAAHRIAGRTKGGKGAGLWEADFTRLFIIAVALAFVLLWVGSYDVQKNASFPFLFILLLAVMRLLESRLARMDKFIVAVTVMLIIGAATPVMEIRRAVHDIAGRGSLYQAVQPTSIFDLPFGWEKHIIAGDLQSAYYRYFARVSSSPR